MFKHQCNTIHALLEEVLKVGHFMKKFSFNTNYNSTQEPQDLLELNCACGFISMSALIKYLQLLSKVIDGY